MKIRLIIIALLISFAAMAQSEVHNEMLSTFMKYTSIDSQSAEDSVITAGQRVMALQLKTDVEEAIVRNKARNIEVTLSPENYLYVTIPANTKNVCPTLGISCHLDVTPEAQGGVIVPIIDEKDGDVIVRTDGSTLLGADDKCGCTIAVQLIRKLLADKSIKHGTIMFAFCPNEDVGRAAENIDASIFSPDILFDIDGEGGRQITKSNFTARGFNVKFIGRDAHPGMAKAMKYGDATAAAATFIAAVPVEHRPENTDGLQGYIHPWSFEKTGSDATVLTRIRYFDKAEGEKFDKILNDALKKIATDFPNVEVKILYDDLQYENVAYTLHPKAQELVTEAARSLSREIVFVDERGGTTASMFAAKGLKGGMGVFSGQHDIHSTREYANLREMEDAYLLMLEIIKRIPSLKS